MSVMTIILFFPSLHTHTHTTLFPLLEGRPDRQLLWTSVFVSPAVLDALTTQTGPSPRLKWQPRLSPLASYTSLAAILALTLAVSLRTGGREGGRGQTVWKRAAAINVDVRGRSFGGEVRLHDCHYFCSSCEAQNGITSTYKLVEVLYINI